MRLHKRPLYSWYWQGQDRRDNGRIVVPVARENLIGEYLRARRELVRPQDVGIPDLSGRRRVPGLRREEVAMLAGVSSDYYVRLEQGRDQHPSQQVLDALARALQLDDDATAHLHRLATPPARRRHKTPRPEKVPAGILQLIASWSQSPAYVQGRYMDVLAANPLATALAPYYVKGETSIPPSKSSTRSRAPCNSTTTPPPISTA